MVWASMTSTSYRFALVVYESIARPKVLAYYPTPQMAYADLPHLLSQGWEHPLGLMYVKITRRESPITLEESL